MDLNKLLQKKPVLYTVIAVGLLAYIGINLWVFGLAHTMWSGAQTSQSTQTTQRRGSSPNTPAIDTFQNPTTPGPTPTPLQGPGTYACDPNGICNIYSADMRAGYCSKTYADRYCLKECSKLEVRCSR